MEILFKYAWILFIGVTTANAFVLKSRAKKYITERPELEEGYDKLFQGYLFYGNIPWIVMMVGSVSGLTQGIFDYFNPRSMNPMVLIFHFSIVVLWFLGVRWIYFKNGANFLETHPGLFRKSNLSGNKYMTAKQIKLFYPLMLLGGIIGMAMMWIINFPTPQF
ncbi:hypothetical protein POV27_07675 [Aureisphaera galaxeae]|uniref:hypothetical protein n=1 Tax=Aureisphaera galaxeae TaxID=1538023 RepID=UPI002350B571|nr:hypothetical protein [Aureisphaera galaxeae]MDC8003927.1 hypothetical protein [Aureisphaera galaxeae]